MATAKMTSRRRELVERWMAGYKDWTPDTCAAYRAPGSALVPIGVQALPHWTPEETTRFFSQWDGVMKTVDFKILDWVEDEKENKIAMWVFLKQSFHDHLELEPFCGEYSMIIFFNEDQTAFTRFIEFIDHSNTKHLMDKVNSGRKKLNKGPLEFPKGSAVVDVKY